MQIDRLINDFGAVTEIHDEVARRVRRSHLAQQIIRQDPDRRMVVSVYGESTTQAIE